MSKEDKRSMRVQIQKEKYPFEEFLLFATIFLIVARHPFSSRFSTASPSWLRVGEGNKQAPVHQVIQRDLFIPRVGGHLAPENVTWNHPTTVTKN